MAQWYGAGLLSKTKGFANPIGISFERRKTTNANNLFPQGFPGSIPGVGVKKLKIKSELSNMVDFNEFIDKHLKRENRAKSIGRYYPSEIGGCIRKTWFSYRLPKETDKNTAKVFKAGEMLHEFISEVIKSEKNPEIELVSSEIPVKIETKEFIISGRIDNLMLVKVDEKQYLVEVKSCKFLPNEAKEDNVMQLQLYMHAIGIHDGIVLYIKKDDLQTKSFEFKYNKDMVKDILERFDILHHTLISQKMPYAEAKREPGKQWMCDFCLWREECDIIEEENKGKI